MKKGSAISAPAWRGVMDAAISEMQLPKTSFGGYSAAPENVPPVIRGSWWGGDSFFVDKISGKLATEFTPPETKIEYVTKNPHNILYWINKSNLADSRAGIGISDSQYKNWEAVFQNWIQTNGLGGIPNPPPKPTETDDIHLPQFAPTVIINQPVDGLAVKTSQNITVSASATGVNPITKFELYMNDQFIDTVDGSVLNYQFIPENYLISSGSIIIKVVAVDNLYNRGNATVSVNVSE
jgi:hypothetical protein